MPDHNHAPAWLFAFVDLAFMLLIAMTQVGVDDPALDLGEIAVPKIRSESADELPASMNDRWQLRVHPQERGPAGEQLAKPFELHRPDSGESLLMGDRGVRLDEAALRLRLSALVAEGSRRPVLAPHEDSRSQDLLSAATAIENYWPKRRRVAVIPVLGEVAKR